MTAPVPYPTDPNRPPSNSVGEGGTPPPEDNSASLPPPDYGVPPGPAQVGQWPVYGAPGNTDPGDIPGMIGLPTFPGMGFVGSAHGHPLSGNPYGAPGPRWGDYGRDGGPAVPDSYWDDGDDPQDWELDEQSLFEHDPQRYIPESEVVDNSHSLQPYDDSAMQHSHDNFREHYVDSDKNLGEWWEDQRGREGKVGGILTQADQWPDRVAANRAGVMPPFPWGG